MWSEANYQGRYYDYPPFFETYIKSHKANNPGPCIKGPNWSFDSMKMHNDKLVDKSLKWGCMLWQ